MKLFTSLSVVAGLSVFGLFLSADAVADTLSDSLIAAPLALDYDAHRDALVKDSEVSDSELSQLSDHADPRVVWGAEAILGWRHDAASLERAWALVPGETRAGFLRFTTTEATNVALAPGLIERLLHGNEESEVRAALVEVLSRSDADWQQMVVMLALSESDVLVREAALFALKRVEIGLASPAILAGVTDAEPSIRVEAARAIGANADGGILAAHLVPLLSDADPTVQEMAARSLGWQKHAPAFAELRQLLSHGNAQVRLRALRAMSQIDPAATSALTEVNTLRSDSDSRVSRLADRIAN